MKQIDIHLNLEEVRPLLNFVKPYFGRLSCETVVMSPEHEDEELEEVWKDGLIQKQSEDCAKLLAVFDDVFFESGVVSFREENVDAFLRASAAVRLKIREIVFSNIPTSALEKGEVDIDTLSKEERLGFSTYIFFATLQEVLIKNFSMDE